MKQKNKGFTIVEILVVVAVIGLLASVVALTFTQPKAKSRDAKREKDIKEIRTGIGLYTATTGRYPICASIVALDGSNDCLSAELRSAQAMSGTPLEPRNNKLCDFLSTSYAYCYVSNNTGTDYALYYHLETNSISRPSGISVGEGWYVVMP